MSNPIWVIEFSSDEGETWTMYKDNNAFYRRKETAERKSTNHTRWHRDVLSRAAKQHGYIFRAVEYRAVEGD